MTEQFSNASATTLSASITSGATTLTATDGSTWPSSPQFRIKCENEIMIVTAVSGNTFTVTRGAEGTTAASHAPGTSIVHELTAEALTNLSLGGATYDLIANEPAASKSGKIFIASDTPRLDVDSGSAWLNRSIRKLTPPKLANYSWLNQGSSIAADNGNGIYVYAHGTTGLGSFLVKALAYSAPYSVKFKINPVSIAGDNFGVDLYDSVSGKLLALSITNNALYVQQQTNTSTTSSNPTNQSIQSNTPHPTWLGFKDDGTTRHYILSLDGLTWFDFYSEANTTFMTPTHLGFHAAAASGKIGMTVESIIESTP